jgi:RimJ/RimL family protein N-acetyltransferase
MAILNFQENITLENGKVLLRPLALSDADHLLEFSINEPELWKFSLKGANGKENLINYINEAIENRLALKEYPFIVFDKTQNKYAGSTRFYDIQLAYKTMQLGYTWYGKAFQGTGLNKNCKYLLLEWAFESLGMERVEFRADNNNAKSIAAMKSIGCKVDGILRANVPNNEGGRRDSIVLSILKEEWYGEVKTKLQERINMQM